MNEVINTLTVIVLVYLKLTTIEASNRSVDIYNDLLHTPSLLHGPIKKGGILADYLWDEKAYNSGPGKIYKQWYKDLSRRHEVPPLSHTCWIYFNHELKLIYLRNYKAASSTLSMMFQQECGYRGAGRGKYVWEKYNSKKPGAVDMLKKIWNQYTVFTVTRNPWSRAMSGYGFITMGGFMGPYYRCLTKRLFGKEKAVTQFINGTATENEDSSDYDTDDDGKKTCPAYEAYKELNGLDGFKKFVEDPFILARRCQEHNKCRPIKYKHTVHVEPFARCTKTSNGSLAVDYILRYEHIYEDWDRLQKILNSERREVGRPELNVSLKHCNVDQFTKAQIPGPTPAQLYHGCGVQCVKDLYKYFKEDFDTFGYYMPSSFLELI